MYFVLSVDYYTRMMWVYFIKYKFEAFECFKNLKAPVENEKDSKIKCLRTYRGWDFSSKEFDEFCKEHVDCLKLNKKKTKIIKKQGDKEIFKKNYKL